MRQAIIALSASLALVGCDYVDAPNAPATDDGGGTNETLKRRALLEEFTGHRCNNCPAAHAVAANLANVYGDELIVVGIHATDFFAAPLNPPAANGSYSTDFRTPAGDTYATAFNVSSLPTGMVNRTPYNNSVTISSGSWSSAIAEIIAQDAACDVWFSALEHDAAAHTVTAEVKVAVLQPISGDHNLTVYLTEDHIIDWQVNSLVNPPDVENYDHRHVLRANLNGTWGQAAITGSAAAGDTLTFQFNAFALDPAWNPSNCALIAYLYDTGSDEVMQAAEREFEP
ncbi:MAG: Omp28 family outer membrane lipoprotein [Flavobacteriales bacterium]|nr:Omp28 family outer membrane lipoprotein [Flavobacteriales bacterium]